MVRSGQLVSTTQREERYTIITCFSLLFMSLTACVDGVNESLRVADGQTRSESFKTVNGNVDLGENAIIEGGIDIRKVSGLLQNDGFHGGVG